MKARSLFLIFILSLCFTPLAIAQTGAKFFENFKSIPILDEGRIKPLDTYARNLLIRFSGKDTYEHTDAILWLAKLLFTPQNAANDKVILINDPQIAIALNIKPEEHRRYSFTQLKDAYPKLMELMVMADRIDVSRRSLAENEIIRVAGNAALYMDIAFKRNIPLAQNNEWGSPWTKEFIESWRQMALAYTNGNLDQFDISARRYLDTLKAGFKPQEAKILRKFPLELAYHAARPFMWAKLFYILAFMFFIGSFTSPQKHWYWLGLFSIIAGFIPHALGMTARIIIMGHPPVTNLYETFIFVGFITVFLGLGVEYFNRRWLGIVTAAICGTVLLFIAGKYSAEGDTFKMLEAVLNSDFWLGTHVTTITMGYGAACVAGVLGHIWLIQAAFAKRQDILDNTYKIILGVMGVALTFTFLGTNLGGIWADQSWGRFWGWDPKENGALMIVLWFAILFHAKYAKMIAPLGLAVGCVIGMMVVMWAWLGVNLLSVGLHSYGFTSGTAHTLIIYAVGEIIFIIITTFVIAFY